MGKVNLTIKHWNDKFAAIFEAGYECFLQVAPVLFYKMDAKNTA
jgi:hypothetical protein